MLTINGDTLFMHAQKRIENGFGLVEALLILLIILLISFAGWFVFLRDNEEGNEAANEQTTSETQDTETTETSSDDESVEEATVDETEDYTLTVPEGFERIDERQFTFTGAPERTYTYKNAETDDYFEVNIDPADSGFNSDFTWIYTYSDGEFTLDKSDSTVCTPEESEWCMYSGDNGRLDSAIFSEGGAGVDGAQVYFTFGNTESEEVGDLSYVDAFLEGVVFASE